MSEFYGIQYGSGKSSSYANVHTITEMKKSALKKIARNSVWLYVNDLSSRMIVLASSVYLARRLGAKGFGLFALSLSIGYFVATLADLGVTAGYGVREIAQNKGQGAGIARSLFSARIALSLLLALLMTFYAYMFLEDPLEQMAIISSMLIMFAATISVDWIFRGLERMELIAMLNLVPSLIFLGVIIAVVDSHQDTVVALLARVLTLMISSIIGIIYLVKRLGLRFEFNFKYREWIIEIRKSLHFAANALFINFTPYLPVIMLDYQASRDDVGYFSAAQRVVMIFIALAMVIPAASYPTMAELYVADRKMFHMTHKKIMRITVLLGLILSFTAIILKEYIVLIMFGREYHKSMEILQILICYVPIMMIRVNYGRSLMCAGYQRLNMIANGAGAAASVILLYALIGAWQGIGASVAILLSEVLSMLLMRHFYDRSIGETE